MFQTSRREVESGIKNGGWITVSCQASCRSLSRSWPFEAFNMLDNSYTVHKMSWMSLMRGSKEGLPTESWPLGNNRCTEKIRWWGENWIDPIKKMDLLNKTSMRCIVKNLSSITTSLYITRTHTPSGKRSGGLRTQCRLPGCRSATRD